MTTQTIIFRSAYISSARLSEQIGALTRWLKSRLPRRCMLISTSLLLAGLGVPFLMGLTIIPASLSLGLIGMASACIGCVLTLYYL